MSTGESHINRGEELRMSYIARSRSVERPRKCRKSHCLGLRVLPMWNLHEDISRTPPIAASFFSMKLASCLKALRESFSGPFNRKQPLTGIGIAKQCEQEAGIHTKAVVLSWLPHIV